MNTEDIIKLAREAGFNVVTAPQIERFAALVAAAEREFCARLCDIEASVNVVNASAAYQDGRSMGSMMCARAIRARGQP